MARPPRYLSRILSMLYEKPMSTKEIRDSIEGRRETVWKCRTFAEDEGWISKDELNKYHLTEKGKTVIGKFDKSLETTSFEVYTQVIPSPTTNNTDRPTAKCTLTIRNANRINKLDEEKTASYYRFSLNEGFGLIENNTDLKAATADLVDKILDLAAEDIFSLDTVLDSKSRDNMIIDPRFPGYDQWKRISDLAKTKLRVVIDFDGEKWLKKHNLNNLEKTHQHHASFYRKADENVQNNRGRRSLDSIIRRIALGTNLPKNTLEANRLFASETELKEYVFKQFDKSWVRHRPDLKTVVSKAFDSRLFESEQVSFCHLKFNIKNYREFVNSLNRKNRRLDEIDNVDNKQPKSNNTEDQISQLTKDLEYFENAFFSLLRKAIDEWEKAYIEFTLFHYYFTSKDYYSEIQAESRMLTANKVLAELFYIFCEISDIYSRQAIMLWPETVKDKKLLYKLHSILFKKLTAIRLRFFSILSLVHAGDFNSLFKEIAFSDNRLRKDLEEHIDILKASGLEKDSEALIESYRNIHREKPFE